MQSESPREVCKTVSEEISQILYANGHSVYHPVLVEQLTKYVDDKFTKAREEQEALDATKIEDPFPIMYKTLKNAAGRGDWEAVETLSKAIQRLNFN